MKTAGDINSNLDLSSAGPYDDFVLQLENVKLPMTATPGVKSEFIINNGYKAFESSEKLWSGIVEKSQFVNPVRLWTEWDIKGGRSDYKFSVITDRIIYPNYAFYVQFSDQFLPELSTHNVYTYLYMDSSNSTLKVWNEAPRT